MGDKGECFYLYHKKGRTLSEIAGGGRALMIMFTLISGAVKGTLMRGEDFAMKPHSPAIHRLTSNRSDCIYFVAYCTVICAISARLIHLVVLL